MSETLTEEQISATVDAFVALPRAIRRVEFYSLPPEAQKRARAIIEARRGIAERKDGVLIHTQDEYIRQILQQTVKLNELPRRMESLKANIAERKKALLEHYGEEALAEAENAIEALTE